MFKTTRFRVPRDNDSVLYSPVGESLESLISANLRALSLAPSWLQDLRKQARLEVWFQHGIGVPAGESSPSNSSDCTIPTLVVGGHQPELFHPGVWFKNFLLSAIEKKLAHSSRPCRSLHVIIDHDLAKKDSLLVPKKDGSDLHLHALRFPLRNAGEPERAWEATAGPSEVEMATWNASSQELIHSIREFGWNALLETRQTLWKDLMVRSRDAIEIFSQFRQSVETSYGVCNAELRMSQLCESNSFAKFVFRCFTDGVDLMEIYNRVCDEFRAARKIKNPAQPIPNLSKLGEWLETPFWIYRNAKAQGTVTPAESLRQKLWIRYVGGELHLAILSNSKAIVQVVSPAREDPWCQNWSQWVHEGICIRPRALMTTFYLRYILSDLFVHGIGGGIYDALTDEIAERLWHLPKKKMIVASASLFLPFQGFDSERLDSSKVDELRRQLRSAPEKLMRDSDPEELRLKLEHAQLLSSIPPRGQRLEWHRKMKNVRDRIHDCLAEKFAESEAWTQALLGQSRRDRILKSREYSMLLFPEGNVISRLRELASQVVGEESACCS